MTAEQALERNDLALGYNVSKTQAEQAAWEFMEVNSPSFDLTVINPDVILGPMTHPVNGPKSINESNRFGIADFINGKYKTIEDTRFIAYHFVCPSSSLFLFCISLISSRLMSVM